LDFGATIVQRAPVQLLPVPEPLARSFGRPEASPFVPECLSALVAVKSRLDTTQIYL